MIFASLQDLELQLAELPLGDHGLAGQVKPRQADIPRAGGLIGVVVGCESGVCAHVLEQILIVVQVHLEASAFGDIAAGVQINTEFLANRRVGLAGRHAHGFRGLHGGGGDRHAENHDYREEQAHGFLKNFHNILLSEVVFLLWIQCR